MTESQSRAPVLLVDDDADIREAWSETLALDTFDPIAVANGREALEIIDADWRGPVVTDLRMPVMDGFELLDAVGKIDPHIPVIIVTGHGDIPMAMRAIRAGAYDFIEKPADPEQMLAVVKRASQMRELVLENRRLSRIGGKGFDIERHLIGGSEAMRRLRQQVTTVAAAGVNAVIYGETGAGKEVVARALHELSPRADGPFVAVNCGALPDTLIVSELFGHEAGAFTGADRQRIGKIEQASGGTLFLDEIESMPLAQQVHLLRAIQSQRIERLGGRREIETDFRVIAAAKTDLEEASARGEFREDLYYRIAVASLSIPPLRTRGDDIPALFVHYATRSAEQHGIALPDFPPQLLDALKRRRWKGNVRELVSFAERFALGLDVLPGSAMSERGTGQSLPEQMDAFEKQVLADALRRSGGRMQAAADLLGIPRKKLYLRLQRHGLDREAFVPAKDVNNDT
jgi:two-component system C4-dicarboxylate transport response regulator DctD